MDKDIPFSAKYNLQETAFHSQGLPASQYLWETAFTQAAATDGWFRDP